MIGLANCQWLLESVGTEPPLCTSKPRRHMGVLQQAVQLQGRIAGWIDRGLKEVHQVTEARIRRIGIVVTARLLALHV